MIVERIEDGCGGVVIVHGVAVAGCVVLTTEGRSSKRMDVTLRVIPGNTRGTSRGRSFRAHWTLLTLKRRNKKSRDCTYAATKGQKETGTTS